jgi:hypothetical protein
MGAIVVSGWFPRFNNPHMESEAACFRLTTVPGTLHPLDQIRYLQKVMTKKRDTSLDHPAGDWDVRRSIFAVMTICNDENSDAQIS